MAVELSSSGSIMLPSVPSALRQDNPELYSFLETLRTELSKSALGLFQNTRATADAVDDVVSSLWQVDGTETQLITADEIDMQSKKIINVTDPSNNQDAATKKYVTDNLRGFVDRGDPAAIDYGDGDFTHNGLWIDLDLSSIVPAGAIAVVLYVVVGAGGAVGQGLLFRKNGNSKVVNTPGVGDSGHAFGSGTVIVPCDSGRVIEYNCGGAVTVANVVVVGWFT